jgi:hypothetical protein
MAKGSPSSRVQIAATTAAFWAVSAKAAWTCRARDEEPHGVILRDPLRRGRVRGLGRGQGRDQILLLALQAQGCPAGHQDSQLRATRQQGGHQGRGREHLLEIVQEQEQLPAGEIARELIRHGLPTRLSHPQGLHDGRGHEARIGERGECDEDDAIGEGGGQVRRHLQAEAGFAHAARASEGDQADVAALQKRGHRRHVLVSAEQGGGWDGQGARPDGRGGHRRRRAASAYDGGLQVRPLLVRQSQGHGQQRHRLTVGGTVEAALEVADRAGADPGAFRQGLLGEARGEAVVT